MCLITLIGWLSIFELTSCAANRLIMERKANKETRYILGEPISLLVLKGTGIPCLVSLAGEALALTGVPPIVSLPAA